MFPLRNTCEHVLQVTVVLYSSELEKQRPLQWRRVWLLSTLRGYTQAAQRQQRENSIVLLPLLCVYWRQ